MFDEVQKVFVRCFIQYLKKHVNSQLLAPDTQESIEVAIQCLYAAFDINPGTDSETNSEPTSTTREEDIDIFEMFQSFYIEQNPRSQQLADDMKNEGNKLMKECKYNEALLHYNRAVAFNPKNPIYYCNRAAAQIRLGENEKAITDCKSALMYNSNYGKAYGRLGIAYSNLGKYMEAEKAYEKAIELEPENQDYRNNLEIARNARSQSVETSIPNLTEGINAMLANPAIRNMFNNTEIDLEQLQNMSHNPVIMNTVGQLLSGMQGMQGGGNSGERMPPLITGDVLQLFQNFATQLSGSAPRSSRGPNSSGGENNDQPTQQPPPSN